MKKTHTHILNKIIEATGGQTAFAEALTRQLRTQQSDITDISQQRISKWAKGASIHPSLCLSIIQIAKEKGISCELSDLRDDANLIWPDRMNIL